MIQLEDNLLETGKNKAILISGGPMEDADVLLALKNRYPDSKVYCADAGAAWCRRLDLRPEFVLGDLDSVDEMTAAWLSQTSINVKAYPPEKDYTDTELAIEAIVNEESNSELIILGGLGGRMDHELSNLMLLLKYGRQGHSVLLINQQNALRYVSTGYYQIQPQKKYFGIIPMGNDGMTLSLKNFKYALPKTSVPFGISTLVSNEFYKDTMGELEIVTGDGIIVSSAEKI